MSKITKAEYCRKWRAEHPDYARKRYAADPIILMQGRARNRKWYALNPERGREQNRAWLAAHGEYSSYRSMKNRCLNPKQRGYHNYGGRGITICDRWLGEAGYENFKADMGLRPKGTSIDRINNDGNYEPGNCRWASRKEQAGNKRNSRKSPTRRPH